MTQVIPDDKLLATATETAQKLAQKPAGALQASKRLMKQSTRQQVEGAINAEMEEFASRVRSPEAREVMNAFLEKRPPDFSKTKQTIKAEKVA